MTMIETAETVAERWPDRGLWPSDAAARAHARSVSAEMHSGFGALRQATARLRQQGKRISHVQVRWLHPLNPQLEALMRGFRHVAQTADVGQHALARKCFDHWHLLQRSGVKDQIGPMLGERLHARLAEVGRARTAAARGAAERREPWIPDSLEAAGAESVTDRDVLEAIRFYRESPHRHPNASNRLLFRSLGPMLGFDAFHLVPDLLVQPLMVIVGGRQGSTCQYETGQALYGLARGPDKALVVIPGAGHYDLYHRDEYIDPALDRIAPFLQFHLDP